MKIFLSHPMTGLTKNEILETRESMTTYLQNRFEEAEIINSYMPKYQDTLRPIEALGDSLKLMQDADLVVFHPLFENSNGCKIEHQVAKIYNKPMLIL